MGFSILNSRDDFDHNCAFEGLVLTSVQEVAMTPNEFDN